jgi:hypothetical protein
VGVHDAAVNQATLPGGMPGVNKESHRGVMPVLNAATFDQPKAVRGSVRDAEGLVTDVDDDAARGAADARRGSAAWRTASAQFGTQQVAAEVD